MPPFWTISYYWCVLLSSLLFKETNLPVSCFHVFSLLILNRSFFWSNIFLETIRTDIFCYVNMFCFKDWASEAAALWFQWKTSLFSSEVTWDQMVKVSHTVEITASWADPRWIPAPRAVNKPTQNRKHRSVSSASVWLLRFHKLNLWPPLMWKETTWGELFTLRSKL